MDNIYEYIISHEFMNDFKKNQQYTILTDGELWANNEHITWYSFADFLQSNANHKQKDQEKNKAPLIICIAEKLTSHDILLLKKDLPPLHHWLSLHTGVSSLGEKNMPEENDITRLLSHEYIIKEPYSHKNLQHIIHHMPTSSYSRIENLPLPRALATTWHTSDDTIFISGKKTSSDLTILTSASCIDKVASAVHLYTQWSSDIFDLYITTTRKNSLDKDIKESIERTQRILFVIDHKATEEICMFLNQLILQTSGEQIRIHYLFPQYHLVQSILSDYREEESLFDRDSIANFIESILQE
jgi:hypothetical protein